MCDCSFENLVRLLDKRLGLDERLAIFDHLDRCDICHEAIYNISHDRDRAFFIYKPYKSSVALPRRGFDSSR